MNKQPRLYHSTTLHQHLLAVKNKPWASGWSPSYADSFQLPSLELNFSGTNRTSSWFCSMKGLWGYSLQVDALLKHCAFSSFLDSTFWKDKSIPFPKLRSMGGSSHSIILPWGSFIPVCPDPNPALMGTLTLLKPWWAFNDRICCLQTFFHSLYIEISFNDITGDKTKDKLLSGLISATWNTKLTIFSCHFKWLSPNFRPKGDWEKRVYKLTKPQSNAF